MSGNCMHTIQPVQPLAGPSLTWRAWVVEGLVLARADLLRGLDFLADCAERRRQRRLLFTYDERSLGDIGLSRADVWRESDKPCWRD